MSNEEKNDLIEPWIDPETELSLISMLLGEASEFESSKLMKKMKESPEIGIFYERMSSAHELLNQVSREDLSGPNEEWLMSEERHDALIEMFGSSEPAPSVHEKEFQITDNVARIRPQNYIANAIRRIAKHYKSILLGTAVGMTSLIMIGLSYWAIKPSFLTESATFVITDADDEMIGAERFQQSVRRNNFTPSSISEVATITNEPSSIKSATIENFKNEDSQVRFGTAGLVNNGLGSQDQFNGLGESAKQSKGKPNSSLTKRESFRAFVPPEKASYDLAGDPFAAGEASQEIPADDAFDAADDPFSAPEPTTPPTKVPQEPKIRGEIEIAGEISNKQKLDIDDSGKQSETFSRDTAEDESNLEKEPDKLERITQPTKELADKRLPYSESEPKESQEYEFRTIDKVDELKKLENKLQLPVEKLYAENREQFKDANSALFFNSSENVTKFKTAKRKELNSNSDPGTFGADYGYLSGRASGNAALGGGGFVDGKSNPVNETAKQLRKGQLASFFTGSQIEAPLARHEAKSNSARKASKPGQQQSFPENIPHTRSRLLHQVDEAWETQTEETQVEISETRDSIKSELWFGKTAAQGQQQQGAGRGRYAFADGILAARELKDEEDVSPSDEDTGGAVLNNDNGTDQQVSKAGEITLKKERLARIDRSRIENFGEESRSDGGGAETSILGRRPQPIITGGRKKKKPSPVTGIGNKSRNTETASRQLKIADLSLEKIVKEEPFSTFSLHVSDVSFKLAKTSLLEKNQWPSAEKIRPEEFVNAFDYGDPPASIKEKISCRLEQSIHPFLQQRNLLRVSMRTAATGRALSRPLSLTVLLDKSGSMERDDREESVLRAVQALSSHLSERDTVTMISFARKPRLIGDRIPGNRSSDLIRIVKQAPSEGGTNLEEAINLANQIARRQFVENGINRIVLITDGAANLGDADPESLRDSVIGMRQEGIAFDACGVGAEGINDRILESLTRKGDGRYYFLDRPEDADSGFVRQLAGALRPAARNVKVQIKFNPDRVISYKLTGFEKHRLKKEDFRDDSVDSAELTSAEAGVALYHFQADPNGSGDVGQVFVRFQEMATGNMVERSWAIPYEHEALRLEQSKPSMQLAAIAGMFAEKIRSSPIGETIDLEEMRTLSSRLRNSYGKNKRVSELISMIEKASQLSQ